MTPPAAAGYRRVFSSSSESSDSCVVLLLLRVSCVFARKPPFAVNTDQNSAKILEIFLLNILLIFTAKMSYCHTHLVRLLVFFFVLTYVIAQIIN